jgi:hypothetical protein
LGVAILSAAILRRSCFLPCYSGWDVAVMDCGDPSPLWLGSVSLFALDVTLFECGDSSPLLLCCLFLFP